MQTERKLGVNSKTWLITGASSGLGFALAQYVLEQGDRAVLGARTQRAMSDLVAQYPDAGLALTLDVTKQEDRAAAVQRAETRFGGSAEFEAIKDIAFSTDYPDAGKAIL